MRTIELNLPDKFLLGMVAHREAYQAAIGYLCSWGYSQRSEITTVRIFTEREKNLEAAYLNSDGGLVFFLHAQWNENDGTYSFHS